MAELELGNVPGWSAHHVAKLAQSWIGSAEQVVAISATNGGLQSLAEQLQVGEEEVRRLVSLARAALTPETRRQMEQPFDSDERGMGALQPRKGGAGSHS